MLLHSLADILLICACGLFAALLFDRLALGFAGFRAVWLWPGARIAALCDGIETKLNRRKRDSASLRGRGVVMTFLLLSLAAALGFGIARLARFLPHGAVAIEILVAGWCFGAAGLLQAARQLRLLAPQARMETLQAVALPYLPRDALLQDRHALLRGLLQALAQGLRDRCFAPLMGALLFGLPGLLALRMAALLVQRWSHPAANRADGRSTTWRGGDFAASARSLWNIAALPASLLASTALALAAWFAPGAHARAAWLGWWQAGGARDGAIAVMAGATGTQLGGPRIGRVEARWHGQGSPRPDPVRLRHAGWLFEAARWQLALLLAACALAWL